MTAMHDQLSRLAFFKALSPAAFKAIVERGLWFSLPGGWELFAQGALSQTLFFVMSGRLIVVRAGAGGDEVVGYVRAGEPVGEMSLLSGEAHSASVYALRDSEILAVPRQDFDALLDRYSDLAVALSRAVLQRARHPRASFQQSSPRVFALISTSPSIDIDARARTLAGEIARYGVKVKALSEEGAAEHFLSFEAQESAHDVILLAARVSPSSWYQFALRHADRFLVFARRDARPPKPFPVTLEENSPARKFRLVDLVVLEEGAKSSSVADWALAVGANRIFHWRHDSCLRRLARTVAGKSIGLVLSGGGARAYAHIGVVKALRERGAPIDFVSGASMGAIIAACVAMGWSDAEIDARIRDAFVKSNPLGDHVLPVVALTRGALVEERLAKNFGEALIEELDIPFFCVSSDLALGAPRVHRIGSLRAALRASISLPGILPPVVEAGALLVDGAVMDNFPTEMMESAHRGLTIGVDVAKRGSINPADFKDPPSFFRWIFENGFKSAPPIVSLLMRAATAREETALGARPADIMITPDVPGVELRDWKRYDLAVANGYETAKAALDAHWDDLAPIVEAANAI
ncbi:MAG: patatin-like phospholipase family protein [Amphiplicatus sp.]